MIEKQYDQKLFEFAPDAYLATNKYGEIYDANRVAAELLEVDQELLSKKSLLEFIPIAVQPKFQEKLSQLFLNGEIHTWEMPLQSGQGKVLEVDVIVSAARNNVEQVPHLHWLFRNITLQKQIERELLALNEQLIRRIAFDETLTNIREKLRTSLDEHQILQTAVEELVLSLNLMGCETAIYDLKTATFTICCQYAAPSCSIPTLRRNGTQMADFAEGYYQLLQGLTFQLCKLPHQELQNQFSILACPIVDHQEVLGDLWCFSQKERTLDAYEIGLVQQVANQCAIAIRQTRLHQSTQAKISEQVQLNQLKNHFVSAISHELSIPLTKMKTTIQLLKVSSSQEQRDRYLDILDSECQREIALIADLLNFQNKP